MFSFKHKIYNQKNTREITHQAIVQDQVPPSPNLQLEKKYWRKNSGSQVNCRSFFHEKKGDAEYQAEALRMDGGRTGKNKSNKQILQGGSGPLPLFKAPTP